MIKISTYNTVRTPNNKIVVKDFNNFFDFVQHIEQQQKQYDYKTIAQATENGFDFTDDSTPKEILHGGNSALRIVELHSGCFSGNVEDQLDVLILEIDKGKTGSYDKVKQHLSQLNINYVIYGTFNDGRDGYDRFRVILPLKESLTNHNKEKHDDILDRLPSYFQGIDCQGSRYNQKQFYPCYKKGGLMRFDSVLNCDGVDLDQFLLLEKQKKTTTKDIKHERNTQLEVGDIDEEEERLLECDYYDLPLKDLEQTSVPVGESCDYFLCLVRSCYNEGKTERSAVAIVNKQNVRLGEKNAKGKYTFRRPKQDLRNMVRKWYSKKGNREEKQLDKELSKIKKTKPKTRLDIQSCFDDMLLFMLNRDKTLFSLKGKPSQIRELLSSVLHTELTRNMFTGDLFLPGVTDREIPKQIPLVVEDIINLIKCSYREVLGVNVDVDVLFDLLSATATLINPYRDYMQNCKGTEQDFLDFCDRFVTEQNEKTKQLVLLTFLKQIYMGCCSDYVTYHGLRDPKMLILQGKKKYRKSYFVRSMGFDIPGFSTEIIFDIKDKQSKISATQCPVVELAEQGISNFGKAGGTAALAFFNASIDVLDKKYEHSKRRPRRTTFVTTTNESKFLINSNNRKWMCLNLQKPIRFDYDEKHEWNIDMSPVWGYIHSLYVEHCKTKPESGFTSLSDLEHDVLEYTNDDARLEHDIIVLLEEHTKPKQTKTHCYKKTLSLVKLRDYLHTLSYKTKSKKDKQQSLDEVDIIEQQQQQNAWNETDNVVEFAFPIPIFPAKGASTSNYKKILGDFLKLENYRNTPNGYVLYCTKQFINNEFTL